MSETRTLKIDKQVEVALTVEDVLRALYYFGATGVIFGEFALADVKDTLMREEKSRLMLCDVTQEKLLDMGWHGSYSSVNLYDRNALVEGLK
jgi:hypothetical protein